MTATRSVVHPVAEGRVQEVLWQPERPSPDRARTVDLWSYREGNGAMYFSLMDIIGPVRGSETGPMILAHIFSVDLTSLFRVMNSYKEGNWSSLFPHDLLSLPQTVLLEKTARCWPCVTASFRRKRLRGQWQGLFRWTLWMRGAGSNLFSADFGRIFVASTPHHRIYPADVVYPY